MSYQGDDKRALGTESRVESTDLSLDDALKMYDDAKRYVDTGLRSKWDKYYKVYKGERVIRNYEGISDPSIRESHTIIETLVANIAGGDNPKFHFVRTNEEQTNDTEVLNEMLDYYLVCNQMGLKNQEWVREMLLYGTAILHISWREGKPFIENIPLRDFFVDPTATGLKLTTNPARYAGYEYLADKDFLAREMIYDPDQDKMVPRYQNLDKLKATTAAKGTDGDHKVMDKAFKDMFNGSTLGDKATEKQIHVIKLYDLGSGRLIEIGNRKEFIYNKPSWAQREEVTEKVQVEAPDGQTISTTRKLDAISPFLPFAVLRDYVDTSLFHGEGEMAVIMGDAELLNDYESMDIDNNAYQNTPMYQIDPQFSDLAPEIETIPGAVYPIPKGAISPLERPQLSQDLDQKKDRITERMRNATAANEVVQGNAQDKGRVTATEVSTQLSQAQGRFSTKISNLENEGYAQLGDVIAKMVQIFVTRQQAVRIVGKNGVYFKDYDPWEFNGEWEPHVELDSTIKKNQLEVGQKDNQIFLQLSEDPHGVFDPVEIKRFIIQHIDPNVTDEQFNKMLAKPTPPPPRDPLESISLAYKDAGPWVQGQIEEKLGLTPDPTHMGDMQNQALEQANRGADLMNPMTTADNQTVPGMEHILNPQPAQPPAGMNLSKNS
jgi:hypothetical protein